VAFGFCWLRLLPLFPDRTTMDLKRRWTYWFTYRRSELRFSALRSLVVGKSCSRAVEARSADPEAQNGRHTISTSQSRKRERVTRSTRAIDDDLWNWKGPLEEDMFARD
jgi:hypothetical protein